MKKTLPIFLILLFVLFLFSYGVDSKNGTTPAVEYKYAGSINSKKYHKLSCKWAKKIKPKNLKYFKSKEEAEKQGYVPCKVCKP